MRRLTIFLSLGAATLAAACAGEARINHVTFDGYSAADLAYAASSGPIPVRVFGQPTPGANAAMTAARIAVAMTGANFGPVIDYKVYDGPPEAGYVMVIRFGQGAPAPGICAAASASAPIRVGTTYAAAFCKDGRALSYLVGAVGDGNIASAGFRTAMAGTALELLPLENPEFIDCDGPRCD